MDQATILKTDSQGRISLKGFAQSGQSFILTVRKNGSYVLAPAKPAAAAKIPAREKWVHENPEILASFERSIKQAEEGKLISKGSFARYAS